MIKQFINSIKFDEEKRILVSLKKPLESYLKDDNTRTMIKTSVKDIIGSDFEQLEIGKNVVRVTVKEGTEDKNLKLVETELVRNLKMAMDFMGNMNK